MSALQTARSLWRFLEEKEKAKKQGLSEGMVTSEKQRCLLPKTGFMNYEALSFCYAQKRAPPLLSLRSAAGKAKEVGADLPVANVTTPNQQSPPRFNLTTERLRDE